MPEVKIFYKNAWNCRHCPNSNAVPDGCPMWAEEPFELEDRSVVILKGCMPSVLFRTLRYTNGRATFAAQTAQDLKTSQAHIVFAFGRMAKLLEVAIRSEEQLLEAPPKQELLHHDA